MRLRLLILITAGFSLLSAQELSRGPYRLQTETRESNGRTFHMTLLAADGSVSCQIDRPVGVDASLPRCELFANGTTLLVDAFAGVYELYATNGRMMDRIPFDGRIRPDHERTVYLSGNGIVAGMLVSDPDHPSPRLLVIGDNGRVSLDQPVEGSIASALSLSPNGQVMAAGAYEWKGSVVSHIVTFLQTDGTVLSTAAQEFIGGTWSSNDSLFLAYGKHTASVIDVRQGQKAATTTVGGTNIVQDVLWDGGKPVVAWSPVPTLEAGAWIYTGLSVAEVGNPQSARQVSTGSFSRAVLQRNGNGLQAVIDGHSLNISAQ